MTRISGTADESPAACVPNRPESGPDRDAAALGVGASADLAALQLGANGPVRMMSPTRAEATRIGSRTLDRDALLARMRAIVAAHPRFGYRRVLAALDDEGWSVRKTVVQRLYLDAGLQLVRRPAARRTPPRATAPAGRLWCLDVVHGRFGDGRIFRIVTVVDTATGESVWMHADHRVTGMLVTRLLERIATRRKLPDTIGVDAGSGFSDRAVRAWAAERGIGVAFTSTQPAADAALDAVVDRLRDALKPHVFMTLRDLDRHLRAWRDAHNEAVLRLADTA